MECRVSSGRSENGCTGQSAVLLLSRSAEVSVEIKIKSCCDITEHGLGLGLGLAWAWVFESGYARLFILGVQLAEARSFEGTFC